MSSSTCETTCSICGSSFQVTLGLQWKDWGEFIGVWKDGQCAFFNFPWHKEAEKILDETEKNSDWRTRRLLRAQEFIALKKQLRDNLANPASFRRELSEEIEQLERELGLFRTQRNEEDSLGKRQCRQALELAMQARQAEEARLLAEQKKMRRRESRRAKTQGA